MKIEKISDIQIKCTLSKQDLTDRELRLSELAYGSDKAKALFSELLLQASYECGFDAQDAPLMIEAVPMSKDSLVLILTKVTDPEELNINYSNISTPVSKPMTEKPFAVSEGTRMDDIIREAKATGLNIPVPERPEGASDKETIVENFIKNLNKAMCSTISRAYLFNSLHPVIKLSAIIPESYDGENTLYKIPQNDRYCLSVTMGSSSPEEFNKVCNVCAEYGETVHTTKVSKVYFDEHYQTVIKKKAIQKLRLLNKH